MIGAVLVGGIVIDFSLEATTTDEFCFSCHEMGDNISGADEERLHLAGSGELHGRCADCHLPKPFLPRLRRKLRASAEIYHHLLGTLDSPGVLCGTGVCGDAEDFACVRIDFR